MRGGRRSTYADARMRNVLPTLLHLVVMAAKLCGPGGVRAVIAENLLLKQQLIVLRRARQRAPNLLQSDRLLCGFWSLFLSPERIRKVAVAFRPSTLLAFHQALVRRKYRRLFSSRPCPKRPGPKGPDAALIQAIVDLKTRKALEPDPTSAVPPTPEPSETKGTSVRTSGVTPHVTSQPPSRRNNVIEFARKRGAPCRTRTCDLLVRSQTLYPTELRAL